MRNRYEIRRTSAVILIEYLGQELECIIDKCDLEKAKSYNGIWFITKPSNQKPRVRGRTLGRRPSYVSLARFLFDVPQGKYIHYVNGNPLDHRRENVKILDYKPEPDRRRASNRYEVRGDIAVIYLDRKDGSSVETIIDASDLEKALSFPNKWCAGWSESTKSFRPVGQVRGKTYHLYRWILGVDDPSLDVDHINHDTLDNRRVNLRIIPRRHNLQNLNPRRNKTSSPYRGVSYYKPNPKWNVGKWRAHITINGKFISLGYFDSEEEAAKVALNARRKMMPYATN